MTSNEVVSKTNLTFKALLTKVINLDSCLQDKTLILKTNKFLH